MADTLLLAKRLNTMRDRLDVLWEATDDASRHALLQKQYDKLDRAVMGLISINVKTNTVAYQQATDAVGNANDELNDELDTEEKLIGALKIAAQAIDLVAKIIAAAA